MHKYIYIIVRKLYTMFTHGALCNYDFCLYSDIENQGINFLLCQCMENINMWNAKGMILLVCLFFVCIHDFSSATHRIL